MESEIIRHYYNIKQTDETYQRKLELVDTLYSILANAYPSKLKKTLPYLQQEKLILN